MAKKSTRFQQTSVFPMKIWNACPRKLVPTQTSRPGLLTLAENTMMFSTILFFFMVQGAEGILLGEGAELSADAHTMSHGFFYNIA